MNPNPSRTISFVALETVVSEPQMNPGVASGKMFKVPKVSIPNRMNFGIHRPASDKFAPPSLCALALWFDRVTKQFNRSFGAMFRIASSGCLS